MKLFGLVLALLAATAAWGQQQLKRFTLTANSQCAQVSAQNNSTVGIIVSGTWSGTLTPTLQIAGISGAPTASASVTPSNSTTSQATITANQGYKSAVGGFTQFNLCFTSFVSGSAVIDLYSTQAVNADLLGTGGSSANAVTTAGTLTSGNVVTGAGTKTVQDSGVALSSVATLAGTQTLTGKTLVGPSNGNSVSLLNSQFDGTSHAGTGAAAALFTYTIPANTIGAGRGFRVNVSWTHSTGVTSVTYILKLGGISGTTTCFLASTAVTTSGMTCVIMNKPAVANAQYFQPIVASTGIAAVPAGTNGTSTVDMTTNQDLIFSYNVAATDAVTGLGFNVEAIQ